LLALYCIRDGDLHSIVDAPLVWAEEYPTQWWKPKVDAVELARLRWAEDLSYKEIAARTGLSVSGVKSHFMRRRREKLLR